MKTRPLAIAIATFALASGVGGSLAAGPASQPARPGAPTTKPAAPAAPAIDPTQLYTRASEAYRAGDFKMASDLAEQCQREFTRQRTKPTDPAVVRAAHLQGVSMMKLGQTKRAADVLQKTYSAMAGDRTLVFNVALCDVMEKSLAIRAAKNLQAYATNHPDDEQIVNLWGCAIETAGRDGKNPAKISDFTAAYTRVDALLQATRPGMHRWGTQWLSRQDFAPIEAKRAQQKLKIDETRGERDRAVAAYDRAQSAYKRAAEPIIRTGRRTTHDWYHDNCVACLERDRRNRMDAAEREVEYRRPIAEGAVAAYESAVAEMPKPTWAMRMEPLDPFE